MGRDVRVPRYSSAPVLTGCGSQQAADENILFEMGPGTWYPFAGMGWMLWIVAPSLIRIWLRAVKRTLEVLGKLRSEGLIEGYAIGGAIAAFRYLEPKLTDDLDVFVQVHQESVLVDLSPIYSRLKAWGCGDFKREGIVIEGWPVQFLPVTTALEKEAYDSARGDIIEDIAVRVFTAEHLMAICLALGRPKDRSRLADFLWEKCYDETVLGAILKRHGLEGKWARFVALLEGNLDEGGEP